MKYLYRLLLTAVAATCAAVAADTGEPAADLSLREHLGHAWHHECVSFPLTAAQTIAAQRSRALVDSDGREVTWQLLPAGGQIWLQTDLAPYSTQTWRFTDRQAEAETDLEILASVDEVRISNRLIGLKLRTRLADGRGPIAGIRLPSGVWTADSRWTTATAVTAYAVDIVARGPVRAVVVCRTTFADGGHWTLRFRIDRAEPVIQVTESYDVPSGASFSLALGGGDFRPTHMLGRDSRAERADVRSDLLGSYLLEPWLRWNDGRRGNWLALYTPSPQPEKPAAALPADLDLAVDAVDEIDIEIDGAPGGAAAPPGKDDAMLAIAALAPSQWCDPAWSGKAEQTPTQVSATAHDGVLTVDFPIAGGGRVWLLGVLDRRPSEAILAQEQRRVAPPPQKMVIKHGDFPLDKVKDFVLDWEGDTDNHPVLYVRQADVPALRSRLPSDPKELDRWISQQPVNKYLLDGPVREFFASGDVRLAKRMADKAEEYLQTCVDWYLEQDYLQRPGTAPHMQSLIISVVNLIDPVLSSDAVPPEARKRILARLAFLGYVVSSADYWSPARGYSGFANMTSVVALYRTALGCILPHHPEAQAWTRQGLDQLTWQLTAWSDPDGGWYEAPHYAMVSFDHMLAGFSMAANAGLGDQLYHPRMRQVIEWFAAISTPRDSRVGGFRHQPPIGNTYHGEPNGLYGLVAALYKQRDPQFAGEMQWLFEEHGSFQGLGIGWNFPSMLGYRFLMNNSGVEPRPVNLGSRMFRETGVVLRNTMQPGRETYLHLIAGSHTSHYDYDSGSFILYGKGRVLADDWGYIGKHGASWHNMLTAPAAGGVMRVSDFATGPGLDYLSGSKGAWHRQIAFARDADPAAPNFFLVRDSYNAAEPAVWRLWLTALAIEPPPAEATLPAALPAMTGAGDDIGEGLDVEFAKEALPKQQAPGVYLGAHGATLVGSEDVDMDIFVYNAEQLKLTTETASQRVSTGYRQGKEGPLTNTQTTLIASLSGAGAIATLLYPRLKTEPAPRVIWQANGRIAEVRTAAGTDYLFAAPAPEPKQVAENELTPLPAGKPIVDCPSHSPAGSSTPWVIVNAADQVLQTESPVAMPAGVYVHPHFPAPVTIAWQSPVSGAVSATATVRRAPPDKKNPPPEKDDGVIAELRCGADTLARATVPSGSDSIVLETGTFPVEVGDLLRLVVLPGKSHWFDSTQVDLAVRGPDGESWRLAETLLGDGVFANDLPPGAPDAMWWACGGDAAAFDPTASVVPERPEFATADGEVGFRGTAGRVQVRQGVVILSLGAAGAVRFGDEALTADGPASKHLGR